MAAGDKTGTHRHVYYLHCTSAKDLSINYCTFILQVSEFTDIGKKCLKRLQLQIELRLPAPNPNDCLSVLIDPATKNFGNWLLGADLFLKTRTLLKRKHRDAYMALKNNPGVAQTNAEQDQDKTTEGQVLDLNFEAGEDNGGGADNDDSDEDIDGPSILLEPQKLNEGEVDVNAEADQLFEKWMEFTPKFGDYLIEGSEPLLSNKTTGRVSFREIASKFDTKKYFCTDGLVEYPSIKLLARVYFSAMFNAGFQERVFSSCKTVMGVDQAMMQMDHLEMKALLLRNADLIRQGII